MPATVSHLLKSLQDLKSLDYSSESAARRSDTDAGKVLDTIFKLGIEKAEFSSDERKEVGPLLAEALRPIKKNVESTAIMYRTRLTTSVLRKRSSLQFLLDDYASFPVGEAPLSDTFDKVNIKESVEILDDIIEKWRDETDSDEGASDRESAGGSRVPPSHTWWRE